MGHEPVDDTIVEGDGLDQTFLRGRRTQTRLSLRLGDCRD